MNTAIEKVQFVVCFISLVIGVLLLLSSALFLDVIDSSSPIYNCTDGLSPFRNPICKHLEDTLGGVCGVFAAIIQIAVVLVFEIESETNRNIWHGTSGLVFVLSGAAFALPMSKRIDEVAALLRTSEVTTGIAMKIDFYLAMTAFDMIFSFCGIALFLSLNDHQQPQPAESVPSSPSKQRQPSRSQSKSQRELPPKPKSHLPTLHIPDPPKAADTRVQIVPTPNAQQQQPQQQQQQQKPAAQTFAQPLFV